MIWTLLGWLSALVLVLALLALIFGKSEPRIKLVGLVIFALPAVFVLHVVTT